MAFFQKHIILRVIIFFSATFFRGEKIFYLPPMNRIKNFSERRRITFKI
jgi:hypothetical protein